MINRKQAGIQATETGDLAKSLRNLEEADRWVGRLARRIEPFRPLQAGERVLDVGAATGVMTAALRRAGYDAAGVEPHEPAIETSRELAAELGIELPIAHGWAEDLPFPDESFEFVYCYSVLEHVTDPGACFREAYRVLRPGGVYHMGTTSKICPRQMEIRHFPFFPWYPERVQRRIMVWARDHQPQLVGHTQVPAWHWFRNREVRRDLSALGFDDFVDQWEQRRGEQEGWRRSFINACADHRAIRLLGDLSTPGMEYFALKK